jgi:hypothetical protein
MKKLTEKETSLYKKIDYYNRYKKISENFKNKNRLLRLDKTELLTVFDKLGVNFKYFVKEKFFQIKDMLDGYEFYFHFSPKDGLVEIIFGAKNIEKNNNIGGVIHGVCKLIEISENDITDGYIKMPEYGSYDDLELILKESLFLYEDFKKVVLELRP